MGNQISTSDQEGQLSAAGTIIGFVSFAFTLATFLRVIWQNLQTLFNTNAEIHTQLPNLKQALFEERSHLRALRRRCRSQYDDGAFDVLALYVREMVRQFELLEAPFLRYPYREYDEKGVYAEHGREHPDDVYENQYKKTFGLGDRWLWLRRRSKALTIADRLSQLQTRRIAHQAKDLAINARFLVHTVQDIQDRLDVMDRRLGLGPGPRRRD